MNRQIVLLDSPPELGADDILVLHASGGKSRYLRLVPCSRDGGEFKEKSTRPRRRRAAPAPAPEPPAAA
jgi:hypothetical protein